MSFRSSPLGGQRGDMRLDEFAHFEHVGKGFLLVNKETRERPD